MDTLLFLRQKKNQKTRTEVWNIIAALLLGSSSFAILLSQLKLNWGFGSMFSGGLISGLVSAWNSLADTLGNTEYLILTKFEGAGESYGFFLTILLVVLLVLAYLVIRSRFAPLLLLFTVPEILISLFLPLYPKMGFLVFHAATVFFALMVMKLKGGFFRSLSISLLLAALSLFLVLAALPERTSFTESDEGMTKAGEKVMDLIYGKDDLGHGSLLNEERKIRSGDALLVTMSDPQEMYLKGFIGENFNGNEWSSLTNTTCYQAKELMDTLKNEGFEGAGQLVKPAGFAYETLPGNEITVRNSGADRRIVFVPYDLKEDGSLEQLEQKGGSIFDTGKFKGQQTYTYTAVQNQEDHWTDLTARFFTIALGSGEADPDISDYLRRESYYNEFVYENDTNLGRAERKLLAETIGSAGDQSKGHMDYKLAIETIRTYLEDNFIYTEDPGKPEKGKSGLEQFLESHKGYDVHYATAATLMFRYYGIPARYVEGYLITDADARSATENGTVVVPRSRAHAWTEIYIDGVGYVPLEVTPEFYGIMKEADLSIGISNESLMRNFEELYGNQTEEPEPETSKANGNQGGSEALKILWIVLAAIAGAGLLVLLGFLLKAALTAIAAYFARKKLFEKSDPKTAVSAIYGYMEEKELSPGPEFVALGNTAAYSRKRISEKQRRKMLAALKELQKMKRTRKETGKRLLHGKA